jgi:HAD superfamily hydrolase (TIGR01459 family)
MLISGINEIINKYDFFIFDIWGVVHDGTKLYPSVRDTFIKLNELQKKFCFLSNAPRPASITCQQLVSYGLDFISPDQLITSGDFFKHEVESGSSRLLGENCKKIYPLDQELNREILKDLKVTLVSNIEDADYFLILSSSTDLTEDAPKYKTFFKKALALNKPAICPNPDKIVNHGDSLKYVNGHFADEYRRMGGKVVYFGKPHKEIYYYLLKKFSPPLNRIIAVGDSIETDMTGANKFGIDSLFVLNGIHRNEKNLEDLLKKYDVQVTHSIQELKF